MNVYDCKAKKEELEHAIAVLINEFESETEMNITKVYVYVVNTDSMGQPSSNVLSHVEVEVTL